MRMTLQNRAQDVVHEQRWRVMSGNLAARDPESAAAPLPPQDTVRAWVPRLIAPTVAVSRGRVLRVLLPTSSCKYTLAFAGCIVGVPSNNFNSKNR